MITLTEAKKLRVGDVVRYVNKDEPHLNATGKVTGRVAPSRKYGTPAVLTIQWNDNPEDYEYLTLERSDSDTKAVLEYMDLG